MKSHHDMKPLNPLCSCVGRTYSWSHLFLQTEVTVDMSLGDIMASLTAAQESGRLPPLRDDTAVQEQVIALTYDSLEVSHSLSVDHLCTCVPLVNHWCMCDPLPYGILW
jgi:hypothetical protein